MRKLWMRVLLAVIFIAAMIALGFAASAQSMPGDEGSPGGGSPGGMGGHRRHGGERSSEGGTAPAPRPAAPISRAEFDKVVAKMFAQADTRHDGLVTLAELDAIFAARRDQAIRARFKEIDRDGNGTISLAEFTQWQTQLGSAALSDSAAAEDRGEQVAEQLQPEVGEKDFALLKVIEPLSATLIAKANTNYDAGLSLEELLTYENQRFDAADANHDGYLEMDELRPAGSERGERRGGMPRRPPDPATPPAD